MTDERTSAEIPKFALSVRQPWAWAIIYAGKNIENRSWHAHNPAYLDAKRIKAFCVHAASGMTRAEYQHAAEYITKIHGYCPPAHELLRGGIIGAVELVDIVRKSHSPWFFGTIGLVLANPVPLTPIPATGQLGFFEWKPSYGHLVEPAKWMLPKAEAML
ncbi:hypothetical protein [Bradyrhizobium sp. sGM-13]|uniref:hypothetical protein n=1 Tax=Bradyrhizobium sp. sGM-13 TaxID=2831781 RepID=UPI001BCBA3B7|nr:hypothetical protein [Bradyrhizobium sp. sGM-13]